MTKAVPGRNVVKAVRGQSVEAKGFELGYDCNEAPLGLDFVPDAGDYGVSPVAPGRMSRLIFTYECRTQRVLAESRLPLDEGEFEFSIPLETSASINEDLPAREEGVFTHAQGGTVTVSHPECGFLNFEADFG